MNKKVKILAKDKVELDGILFQTDTPKAFVIINSATAVLKEFYFSFANFLVEHSFSVLIYDYRGIGGSMPKNGLKGCTYKYTDWAEFDMNAAINFVKNNFPDIPLIILGHSVGGQMLALASNAPNNIIGLVTVNTSSGYGGNMDLKNWLRNFFFFNIVKPISLTLFGYGKLKKLGLMEDIPKNIYNDWADWCSVSEYYFNPKFSSKIKGIEAYKSIPYPIELIVATDDEIATKKNVESFWKNISSQKYILTTWLKPSDYELKHIGHFDIFRSKNKEKLWPILLKKISKILNENNNEKR